MDSGLSGRCIVVWLATLLFLLCSPVSSGASSQNQAGEKPERVRTEIPYQDGKLVLSSEFQERITKTRYRAKGHVEITYNDLVMTCEEAEYDEATREGFAQGNTRFSQKKQWLTCSRAEFNFGNQTGIFYNASGFTDEEFFIRGRTILKTGRDTYAVLDGLITSCQPDRPKWSFQSNSTRIRIDHTARLHHMVFKIKKVPVLYFPYLVVPLSRKDRNSGFLPFRTGSSTSKGRTFTLGYFQTLGESADATIYGDYFTKRGLALGGIFRARPNRQTWLYLQGYGIRDRLDQGGAQLVVDGESLFGDGFRAAARVNITSNFRFRQAFAESFRAATIPQEHAVVFVTQNRDSFSTNFAFQREEVFFPIRSIVIRKSPSIEFDSLGKPLGKLPIIFYLRAAVEGLSRIDSRLETPKMVQRLDFYPRVAFRLPSFAGFSLLPSVGVRETFYSDRVSDKPQPEVSTQNLRRQYAHLELDLRTPTLEKESQHSWIGPFKHVIEPVITYRRIHGVNHLDETIRFDEEDVIANTNEVEYGLVNRIIRSRPSAGGKRQNYELMSLSLTQKYFFDPTFGGAFREGEPNIFYPLNTVTGFSLSGIQRNLAPTSIVFRLNPKGGISHDVRADYDMKRQGFRDLSLSTYWVQEKLFIAGTYFKTQALEPGTFRSHQIQGQAGYGSTMRGLSASITLSYNIDSSRLLNSHSRLNYMWDCCGISLEFQQFDLGMRTESRVSFSFTLKGIGSFGNVKRPESLF